MYWLAARFEIGPRLSMLVVILVPTKLKCLIGIKVTKHSLSNTIGV
jgi:hypothetical protein